jgi:lipid II:glycine glycyltransferase (peptidoglycan interpeptide bridge formation enzyme)
MNIQEITENHLWNNFIATHGPKSGAFLQSWEWGEFQKNFGRKIWRLGLLANKTLTTAALIIKHQLPLGKSYLYCPRGPVMNYELGIINYEFLIKEILKIAEKEKSIFFRFEPLEKNYKLQITNYKNKLQITNHKNYKLLKTKSVQPPRTLMLDLTKSEDDLLAAMHPKTRYNIRLAMRHGVTVYRTRLTDHEMLKNDFEIFWNLLSKTSRRDGFKTHPKNYYWQMLNSLAPRPSQTLTPNVALYFAKYQNKVLAANLIMFFDDTVTYLHGASSSEHRNVMAPHLLHWSIISEAKRLGFKYYDFWGIDEAKWPGITRFKKSFGGFEISYLGTFDLPVNKLWYKIYYLAKNL